MKKDLDQLMEDEGIDALWICGALQNNPDMVYFTGIHHVNNTDLFKICGEEPILFHMVDMESEEAAKSGIKSHSYFAKKPLGDYFKEANGDLIGALAKRIEEAFNAIGLTKGKVAMSGKVELGYQYALIERIKNLLPNIDFVSFLKDSPIEKARMTKSPDEINHIYKIGQVTTEVIGRVQRFLQEQQAADGHLVFPGGSPVFIRDIKNRIRSWLAELDADNPEGTIFSIGSDCGIPHNVGNPDDMIPLGVPIVFDIFPCEAGGGYFYDITRTWCLGYAPAEVAELHQQVLAVHDQIIDELKVGEPFKTYQDRTCELFNKMGHQTIAEKSTTTEGYIHSIGHGVGLNLHEKPFSGIASAPDDILKEGVVFTIEPGLYYSNKGMGVRIEDTLYLTENGEFEVIADYHYDLIIPVSN
ncbi:MAG: aminopeptidase P family protein [Anaerolineaceae bacterium]|nr:aminopeptidase P family protein [Anaerolineaceae bacterium]